MGQREIVADEIADRMRHILDGNYRAFQRGADIKVELYAGSILLSRAAADALVDEYHRLLEESK